MFNSPIPSSMASECLKCSAILTAFATPGQVFGPDKIIPRSVLANARGLAVITVFKAGMLSSGRFGSGLIVARLPDGSWSPPSAIATAGAGFGGQIGVELTDFVIVLNSTSAVKAFADSGSLMLGGNVSVAMGPVGRNAEAGGVTSLKGVAGVFSYSRTKGLFAGMSIEGSAIVERRSVNQQLYGTRYTAQELLTATWPPPPETGTLMAVLNSPAFSGKPSEPAANNIETQDGNDDEASQGESRTNASSENQSRKSEKPNGPKPSSVAERGSNQKKSAPGPRPVPKSKRRGTPLSPAKDEAISLYSFDAQESGDLGFDKGETITILDKSDDDDEWWTGKIGSRRGVFPSNYVEMK